jgi:hypothetical protein
LIEEAREIANVFAGFSAPAGFCTVKSMKTLTVDRRVKDFPTEAEIKQFLDSARNGRRGERKHRKLRRAYYGGERRL